MKHRKFFVVRLKDGTLTYTTRTNVKDAEYVGEYYSRREAKEACLENTDTREGKS